MLLGELGHIIQISLWRNTCIRWAHIIFRWRQRRLLCSSTGNGAFSGSSRKINKFPSFDQILVIKPSNFSSLVRMPLSSNIFEVMNIFGSVMVQNGRQQKAGFGKRVDSLIDFWAYKNWSYVKQKKAVFQNSCRNKKRKIDPSYWRRGFFWKLPK